MDDEKLKIAKNLSAEITELKNQIEYWEKGKQTWHVELTSDMNDSRAAMIVHGKHINFEVLKTLTLQTLKQKLEQAEYEYVRL